ncbi:MAG TPA: FAD binding domain-containing protein [Acidimicrobiales bacterium]|nr:FAD binding domain-containing protein [Acidimicrobiales bacterium]
MTVLRPDRLADALAALAGRPAPTVLAGGTDLMVEVNYGQRRLGDVLALRDLDELRAWRVEPGTGGAPDELVLGAATTYTALLGADLSRLVPALAQAARTVGGPQIRNTGTVGGNLATGSPAGDTLPVLAAHGARVELAASGGRRTLPVADFLRGPKLTALTPDELIVTVRIPLVRGPAEFLKVGVRNAMVIAVANCALVVDRDRRTLGCALGSVGPVPVRDASAEAWVTDRLDWDGGTPPDPRLLDEFGRRMAAACRPIDDHRATADYRRHAVEVMARRALERAWERAA